MARDVTPLVVRPHFTGMTSETETPPGSWIVMKGRDILHNRIDTKKEAIDLAMDEQINRFNVGVLVMNMDLSFGRFIPNERFWESYTDDIVRTIGSHQRSAGRKIVMRR